VSAHYTLSIYNRQGDLWDSVEGREKDLRTQGATVTSIRGQLAWSCTLRKDGHAVATCKRGVWKDVTP
jgi:hypothetical protein